MIVKKQIIKQLLLIALPTAISSFLSYAAQSDLFFDKLIEYGIFSESINISLAQDYCLWIGIFISFIFLSSNLFITKIKYNKMLCQRNLLIKMSKDLLTSTLGARFLSNSSNFDIRIFVPKHPTIYSLSNSKLFKCLTKNNEKLTVKKKFSIINDELIAEEGITKGLQFEVFPNPQGLVGKCYNSGLMVYDDNLEKTNSTIYSLNKNQIAKTSNLKWSICCPVFNDNEDIIAIIALDGKTKIRIDDDEDKKDELRQQMIGYSRMLYDSVPQLFRR